MDDERMYGHNEKKIAVIFPGIGYNIDRPLLYYSRKIALEHNYEVASIEFSNIAKNSLKDREKKMECLFK